MFGSLRSTVVDHASRYDADALTGDELVDVLDDLDVIARAIDGMFNDTIRRVDVTGAHGGTSALDAARFVADRCVLSVREVRDRLETAHALAQFPATAQRVREGTLSTPAAKLIADAISVNPDAEQALLAKAGEGLHRLRGACIEAKAAVQDPAERATRQKTMRKYSLWTDTDGMLAGMHRLRPEDAGAFKAFIDAETDRLFRLHATAKDHEPREAYAADALVNYVLGRAGRDAENEPSVQRVAKYNVHILIDHGLLTGRYTHDGAKCEIPGVGPVDPEWVRSLLGDAVVDFLVMRGKDVTTITTPSRKPTKAMRTVLLARGLECKIVGCDISGYVEIDHRHEVQHGGPTRCDNIDPFCSQHHHLKTIGWILGPADPANGKRTLRPPSRGP